MAVFCMPVFCWLLYRLIRTSSHVQCTNLCFPSNIRTPRAGIERRYRPIIPRRTGLLEESTYRLATLTLYMWNLPPVTTHALAQWRTQEFFSGGVQQIQLRTEGKENGDLGAVAP
jgi:hypothetical protein